jgi:gliding motility-associated-like protein
VVNAVGTTNISFSYIDNLGCSTSSIVPIILINPIQPIISGSQTICSGQTGVEYQIDNVGLTSFDWLVTGGQIVSGDNTSSIIVDWDENLQTFGTVAVSTLDNNSCASATVSQQVNVNNSNAPTAGFVVDYNGNNDQVLCLGETVAIDNNTISAESYVWQVVEANSGTIVAEYDTQIPDLEFDTPGVYNLLLTAYGCGSTQDEYEILEAYTIVENPDVTLNAASEYACLGDTVSIQSNLTEGSFNWIGDNLLPSTSATVSLVVTEELNVIELEYTNANGCSDASSIVIFVDQSQNVVANFTPGVTGLCPGEDFVINNNSTGGQYTWSITAASTGEPINVTGTDPIIAPTVSDSYYVSLIADGCAGIASFSDTISVEVYSIPEFEIVTDSLAVCAGDTITLSVTGLDGSFVWAGNGIQSSTGSAITAIVSDTTEYSVIYTTAEGCVAPQKAITIVTKSLEACTEDPDPVDPIVPKLFPDVITPNGDGANDTWNITALADYPNNKVEIYSRWGALLYESNSPYDNSFDGTIDGKELPKGTYYYIIYFNDSVSKPKTGTITIL